MKHISIRQESKKIAFFLFSSGLILLIQSTIFSQKIITMENNIQTPKVISFNPVSDQYQSLLNGENDSVGFYSGFVTLLPDTKGELHSTEKYEEMIVVLEGEGQLNVTDQNSLKIKFGQVAYVPPHTEHQMENTGKENLKYIYIAHPANYRLPKD